MRTCLSQALIVVLGLAAPGLAQEKSQDKAATVRRAADEAYQAGNWEQAIKGYHTLVKLDAKDARSWHRLGYVLHAAGDLEKALEVHRKAASFKGYETVSLYNVACVYSLWNKKDKAFSYLKKAVESGYADAAHIEKDSDLDNLRDDPRYGKVVAAIAGKAKYGKAKAKSKTKGEKTGWAKPDKAKLTKLGEKGDAAFGQANWKTAAKIYGALVENDPDNGTAWFRLGYSLHALGRLDEALKAHHRATKFDKFRALGCYNAACVHAMKNETDTAFKWLHKAIDAGFTRLEHIAKDSDLDNLRDDARYSKLLAMAKGKKAKWATAKAKGKAEHGGLDRLLQAREKITKRIQETKQEIADLEAKLAELETILRKEKKAQQEKKKRIRM